MKISFDKIMLLLLVVLLVVFVLLHAQERGERKRIEQNFRNIQHENKVLELNVIEFRRLNIAEKEKLDSVMNANKIAIKSVKEVTVVKTVYRDTGRVELVPVPVREIEGDTTKYVVAVEKNTKCWGMKAEITSTDAHPEFAITEQICTNNAQLFIVRKRFWGFLWFTKNVDYKAYSDCGEINFTKIEIRNFNR